MKKSGLKVKTSQMKSPRKSVKKVRRNDGSRKKSSSRAFEFQIYHDPPSSPRKTSSPKKKKSTRQPLKNITNTLRSDGIEMYKVHYGHKSSPKRIKSNFKKVLSDVRKQRKRSKTIKRKSDGGKRKRSRSPLKLRK